MTMTARSDPSTVSVVRGGVLGAVAAAAGIALTATSGWLIVRAAERPVILTLLTAIVMVRAFGIARPVFRYWERLVSHDAALGLLARRRTSAYQALIPLTPARLGTRRRSEVLTGVVDDLTDEVEATVRVTVPVIGALLAGSLVVALTTALEPTVGAVLAALMVVVAAICVVAARLETRSLDQLLGARDEVARVAALATSQADQLQAVGAWPTALRWLDDAHTGLAQATRRVSLGRASAAAGFLIAVGGAVVTVAVLMRDLDASGPVKALLTLTPVAASEAIAPLVDAMRARARARAAAGRTRALLGLEPAVRAVPPPAVTDAGCRTGPENVAPRPTAAGSEGSGPAVPGTAVPGTAVPGTAASDLTRWGGSNGLAALVGDLSTAPDIALHGVTASWNSQGPHLGPVDLDLPCGSRVAVTGPNGAGKSTLLAVLARNLDPTGGAFTWNGVDVSGLALTEVRDRIAVVDDEPHVFATTLRNNLTLAAPEATDADLLAGLRRVGLAPFVESLPHGLDTVLGTGGRGVSGGERARLGIARALLSRRPVVLLDEPVAHLDPPTARAVVADLLAEGTLEPSRTIVMVTHRDEGLDLFDRVLDIADPTRTAAAE
ncbi:thiol reductant ABC exporter subunit CydC [Humibacillus sp. DSM 29435]|uniref:amino acid ABC transporter ATP-binding/permease protein n=1 Tax=Humibacillus sp. DSM 29435 TaxID=1869167 RepID=UPI00087241C5|nr:ATP-binding cassette domain-containing protein [Humibacillus sp. DSM 29435]OFE18436.1 thiol reductant ABC exporter subunit CydC [Humibacillus sp. DSM 29435]